jgi:hypothetical protein
MLRVWSRCFVAVALSALFFAAVATAQPYQYTVTNISATAFQPAASGQEYFMSGSSGRYIPPNQQQFFWTALLLPPEAIVDYIGINNLNDGTPIVVGAALYARSDNGDLFYRAGTSNTPHTDWETDINAVPFGIFLSLPESTEYLLRLEFDASANPQYIGAVQVWWRTTVNPGYGGQIFNDVPITDPGFPYIEALAVAGITGGCGGGNFCPDNPVTRRQMAIFLSKALGLNSTVAGP